MQGIEEFEGFPGGADVVDAEELGALADAVGEEGEGAGVSVFGVGLV